MKNYFNNSRGFTLIELLVVVAIIGILSVVVLVVLSDAKSKGRDAAVKTNLKNAQKKAEAYYYENYNYTGICAPNPKTMPQTIIPLVLAAGKASGVGSINTVGTSSPATYNTAKCFFNTSAWAAEVPLTGSTNPDSGGTPRMLCIDSTGAFKETSGLLGVNGASTTACP